MPILGGNFLDTRAGLRSGIEDAGFLVYGFYGVAAIGVSQANGWSIADVDGNASTIVASANDPAYLAYCSFNLPAGLVADAATRVIKLAPAATTAAGANSASSAASGTTPFAFAAEAVRSASVPGTTVAITGNTTFNLYSTDGANAAAGTFGSALGIIYVDCEIIYLKRKPAIVLGRAQRSKSQAYVAAGVAAGVL